MGYSNNRIFGSKVHRGFWAVDATVVKVQTQPTRMRFATVWKYCEPEFQNVTEEVLCAGTMLLSHQIGDVEFIDSPNKDRHELWVPMYCFTF
jgi:hypothetical protein